MSLLQRHPKALIWATVAGLTLALAAVCSIAWAWHQELADVKTALAATNKQLDALKLEVGTCTTQRVILEKASNQVIQTTKELTDQVEAFAVQAKNCALRESQVHSKE